MLSGTPAATPVAPLKPARISLRTTPDWFSTLMMLPSCVFVPSAGYGPPVSSGITGQATATGSVMALPPLRRLPHHFEVGCQAMSM